MDAIGEVKQRLSIDEVVGGYVELKRSGRNLKGLCPFHAEKTPSFMVNPEKGIYHCFGCGEGGDHFEFVMKMEGLSFREALEKLAQKSGLDLSQYSNSGAAELTKLKTRFIAAHELAAKYYQQSLIKNQPALDYVTKNRHFNKNTITDFKVGYAPRQGTALRDFLRKKGFNDAELIKAGLVAKRRGDIVDMFYARVLVALTDVQGRVIGFTGRVIDDSMPKYLNTAQTILYDKSRHIFGLDQAKKSIREQDQVIFVEGNFDVLASHQINVKNVVASAGTALTYAQLKQISRLTNNVAFAFDQDKAGLNATMRAIPIAQQANVNISIILIDGGKDPDELIQKDPRAWQKAVEQSVYVMDWLFDHLATEVDLKTASGKTAYSNRLLPVINELSDPIEQEHYLKLLADRTEVSLDAVKRKLNNPTTTKRGGTKKIAHFHIDHVDERKNLEENLLALLLIEPSLKESLSIAKNVFTGERTEMFLSQQLSEDEEYATILQFKADELYGEWTEHQRASEAQVLLERLTKKAKQQKQVDLTLAIREAEARGDSEAVHSLLEQYNDQL